MGRRSRDSVCHLPGIPKDVFAEALADILEQRHVMPINGKRKRATMLEIYVRTLTSDAERGNRLAHAQLISRFDDVQNIISHEASERTRAEARRLDGDRKAAEMLRKFESEQQAKREAAAEIEREQRGVKKMFVRMKKPRAARKSDDQKERPAN